MTNSQLYAMLKDGDVVHVHTSSLLGEAIRLFERIRYGKFAWANHTAIISIEDDKVWLNEANPKMMRTLMSDWMDDAGVLDKKFIVTRISEPFWTEQMTVQNVKNDIDILLGTKYNYLDILVSCPIFMLTGRWINGFWNNGKRYFCSQVVSFILNKYTRGLFSDIDIAPAKVYQELFRFKTIYKNF